MYNVCLYVKGLKRLEYRMCGLIVFSKRIIFIYVSHKNSTFSDLKCDDRII